MCLYYLNERSRMLDVKTHLEKMRGQGYLTACWVTLDGCNPIQQSKSDNPGHITLGTLQHVGNHPSKGKRFYSQTLCTL